MKKHDKKYIEVEGIMRACYDSFLKTGNKAYSDIIALADAVPAADVQEVRHGRWKCVSIGRYACSICGCEPWYSGSINTINYCPNCGALMELKNLTDEVEE